MGLSRSSFAFAIFTWALLLLRFGYQYGTGDQVELLPYVLYLNDSSLYPHDFFIQSLHASLPNERTVMAHLLLPFVNYLEVICFILHFLVTVVLVLGLEKLGRRFIANRYVMWAAILVALIPLREFTLGGIFLYSECLQASYVAIAFCVWAINFFLDKKYIICSVLMSIATFIHVLEGLDVMIVLSLIMFILALQQKVSLKNFSLFWLIYAFTAGLYLLLILRAKSNAPQLDEATIFGILFEFRHPHHFIFSSFSKIKTVGFIVLSAIALIYFRKNSTGLWWFSFISITGIAVYAFITDCFHFIFIANFQFYKLTQWMNVLGAFALFAWLADVTKTSASVNRPIIDILLMSMGSLLCAVAIFAFPHKLPFHVAHQVFQLKSSDPVIDICKQIEAHTDKEAVFIQPFENTELKFYGRRSSYCEFKANVKDPQFVQEWYKRIQMVYNVSLQNKERGFELQQIADEHFYHLSAQVLENLKKNGVTHILTKKELPPPIGSLTLSNNTYAVYQL